GDLRLRRGGGAHRHPFPSHAVVRSHAVQRIDSTATPRDSIPVRPRSGCSVTLRVGVLPARAACYEGRLLRTTGIQPANVGNVATVLPQEEVGEPDEDPSAAEQHPRRVMIVSASIGEGHNAAGEALREAVGALWPRARVDWVDVLTEMGFGSGPVFRRIYAGSVRRSPWLYDFFYRRVRRSRWLQWFSNRLIGAWSGRAMARVLRDAEPDMVLSTYPMATTGLEWLRRHRG